MPIFSIAAGRAWLAAQPLPDDERAAIDRHVRELDRLAEDLALLDRENAENAIDDPAVKRLITITRVNLTVAAGIVAAIGDIRRSIPAEAGELFGLNPRVRQSGWEPLITVASARSAAVKRAPCWSRQPGGSQNAWSTTCLFRPHPHPARPSDRHGGRGPQLCWHLLTRSEDYRITWGRAQPWSPTIRAMQLQAGQPQQKGSRRGPAYAYNIKTLRDREMLIAAHAERTYERFVAQWKPRRPKIRRAGASGRQDTSQAVR
jgi:transposase